MTQNEDMGFELMMMGGRLLPRIMKMILRDFFYNVESAQLALDRLSEAVTSFDMCFIHL